MKTKFPGYYSTPEESLSEIWSSESTLFVFDTNCLLNLYRCEEQTREDILKVMETIANRIWIPFQVGLEFQKNRRVIINSSIESLENIKEALTNIYMQNMLDHGKVKRALYNKLSDGISKLQDSLKKPIDSFIESEIDTRIKSKQTISSHDFIRDAIDKIIGVNIGDIPTQEAIDEIDKEGEQRYLKKIPPGFKDSTKKDITYHSGIAFQDKFGDLYLWKELITKAGDEHIKNVVLISDDTKDDWLFKYKNTTHGPLESLKTEICQQSKIENFKLINQFTFLNEAKKYLENVNVSDESLEEIENLSLRNSLPDSNMDNLRDDIKNSFIPSLNDRMIDLFESHTAETNSNNKKERNFLRSQANSTLSIFDRIVEKTLSILNELVVAGNITNKLPDSTENIEIYQDLSYALYTARIHANELIDSLICDGDIRETYKLIAQLQEQCDFLEKGNSNAKKYLLSLF